LSAQPQIFGPELEFGDRMEVRNEQKAAKDLQRPVQYRFLVQGEIDAICLRSAWQKLARKCWGGPRPSAHGNGHSNGTGNGAGKQAPWQEHDLRGLTSDEAQQWITSFLETDGQQEISAQRFPAMRGALLLTEERKAEMLWSLHPTLSERLNLREAVQDFVMDSLGQVRVTGISAAPAEKMKWSQELRQARASQPAVAPAAINAPVDRAEEELIAIWEAVLNRKQIKATDDFFDLGGHSLLAARLMARIEDAMGLELPLASLLEAPTVRAQAQLVREYRGQKNGETSGANTSHGTARQLPFFFLGGDPTFRPLSQRLSELREFHSLGMQMSVLEKLNDRSMESIAKDFVRSIRERCPQGPYMLSGWCAHGLLAYEVAQQLRAQGQEVAEVLLLEAVNPVRMHQYSGWKRTIARLQLKWHLLKFEYSYLKQLDSRQTKDYVGGRVAQKLARMKQSLRRVLKSGPDPELQDPTTGNPLDILYAAAAKYEPKPYRGRVVLIRSTQRTFGFGHVLDLGWTEVLGENLEICETPGNHYSIYMQPNVDALALKMQASLRKAEQQTRAAAGIRR